MELNIDDKKVVKIPIIGVGGTTDPEYTEKIIVEGMADLVALGRAFLNELNWRKK